MTRSKALAAIVLPIAILLAARRACARPGSRPISLLLSRSGRSTSRRWTRQPILQRLLPICVRRVDRETSHPPDQPSCGRFNELQDRNNAILRDILDSAAKPTSPADMRKIGDYYATCMDEKAIDAKEPRRSAGPGTGGRIKAKTDIPAVVGRTHLVGENAFWIRRRAGLQGRIEIW